MAGTVQVWKELCRRDFGALLEAHRQAQRSSAATSSSGAEPMDEEDCGKEEHKTQHRKKQDQKGEALEDEEEGGKAGSSSLFRKVLVTGLALRLGRGLAQRGQKNQADDDHDPQPQPHHHHHVDEDKSYKELYRTWASRVLIVYHVYSNDQAEQDVERVLRLEGIEGKYTTRVCCGALWCVPPVCLTPCTSLLPTQRRHWCVPTAAWSTRRQRARCSRSSSPVRSRTTKPCCTCPTAA